jgi:hypothetical protein
MITHTGFQKQAQDELDAVVGRSHAPTFASSPNIHDWPRNLSSSDPHFRSAFRTPRQRTISLRARSSPRRPFCPAYLWQCHHDPTFFGHETGDFNPERFLDENGTLIPGPVETRGDGHSTYGLRRRFSAWGNTLPMARSLSLWSRCSGLLGSNSLVTKMGKRMTLNIDMPLDTGCFCECSSVHWPAHKTSVRAF